MESLDPADAQYLVWSRTWETALQRGPLHPRKVERQLATYFRQLCRRIEPSLVLEIGAHGAEFSLWAAEEFPKATVTAYEANPYVYEKFAPQFADSTIDYLHLAVGPVTGDLQLNVPTVVRGKEHELASRRASLEVHLDTERQEQVTVPSTRLDDHLSLDPSDRAVAWIDVEGANRAVLEGGGAVLDQVEALLIELEPVAKWDGQWLDTDVARFLRGEGLLPVARDIVSGRGRQYNAVFARAEHLTDPQTARQAARLLQPGDDVPTPSAPRRRLPRLLRKLR